MEEELRRGEGRPQLLDFIPNRYAAAEEKKLELRLGLPGEEDWSSAHEKREHPLESSLSLGHISKVHKNTNANASSATKRGFLSPSDSKPEAFKQQQQQQQQQPQLGFLQLQAKGKESLQKTSGSPEQQSLEGKACGPLAAPAPSTIVHRTLPSRAANTPVVGWPPIRSFRKNLAGTAKPSVESQNLSTEAAKKIENDRKGLFVKINMDGIPIGRKVDLKACDSYDNLSLAVDKLFRGLLSAQMDPLVASALKNAEENHVITGLLDGSGEYTLVYEDDEGDRMLVGDVPWDMFVSTAKRLRVLKSSDLSASSLGAVRRKRGNDS